MTGTGGGNGRRTPREANTPDRVRAADILRPTFKRFVWHTYDNLWLLVVANLLWLLLCLPVVTAPAATAGLFNLARKIADGGPATLRDFFDGFRGHFLPAIKVGTFTLALASLVWINIDFYSHLQGWATIPGMLLAAVMVWASAFLLLMHAHIHPLIAHGECSLRTVLRKSALLTLDNPAFTIGITVQSLSVAVICLLTGLGLVLVLASLLAILLVTGHRELLKKYFPESPESDEPDETRGWRDFWRPWQSARKP